MKTRLKPLAAIVLCGSLITQLSACGSIFYPERRGQISSQIDPGVAILNGIGLLIYIIPGLIAFGVDFATGAIYLPNGKYSVAPETLQQAVDADGQVDTAMLQQILKQQLGQDLPLAEATQIKAESLSQLALLQHTGRG
ncbi:polyribonucleotide nucleotidyltransferase [Pseudomonas abyssi]|uniref:Polyribonucleotide nucleotidyltransferase n=1 Tax=Pseudomonas abyssi TaxID=170540 RepID=A0A395R971_9PSED|nr:polyribonucleotide nucleotidyltransferase [Halopseudomonas gallaeciensis]RGP56349.1 polyribonucleotide nucleotidyltransferase [Halopseudomonas gallaeciensis]